MLILKALNEPSRAIYSSRKSIHYLSRYARDRAGVQAEQTLIIPGPDLSLPVLARRLFLTYLDYLSIIDMLNHHNLQKAVYS